MPQKTAQQQKQDDIDDKVARLCLAVRDVADCALSGVDPDGHGPVVEGDALVACAVLARTIAITSRGG